MLHKHHGEEITVSDATDTPVKFRAFVTHSNDDGTKDGFALVDRESGFGWPKGVVQFFENFKNLGDSTFGA